MLKFEQTPTKSYMFPFECLYYLHWLCKVKDVVIAHNEYRLLCVAASPFMIVFMILGFVGLEFCITTTTIVLNKE